MITRDEYDKAVDFTLDMFTKAGIVITPEEKYFSTFPHTMFNPCDQHAPSQNCEGQRPR